MGCRDSGHEREILRIMPFTTSVQSLTNMSSHPLNFHKEYSLSRSNCRLQCHYKTRTFPAI